jgi:hypothetical protein
MTLHKNHKAAKAYCMSYSISMFVETRERVTGDGKQKAVSWSQVRLAAVGALKRYSKAIEYEYRVKTAALGILKRYI